jgi:hypothetical protein
MSPAERGRRIAAAIMALAMAGTGAARAADPASALADRIVETMAAAERWADASEFPPDYAPVEIARYALIVIDEAHLPHAVEEAALDKAMASRLSDAQVHAVGLLREQIAND